MSALDEVKRMQSQGMIEDQIIQTLQNQGVPYKDISEALSQSKIKAAIEEPATINLPSSPPSSQPQTTQEIQAPSPTPPPIQDQTPQTQDSQNLPESTTDEMQQSMLQPAQETNATEEYMPTPTEQDPSVEYGEQYSQEYQPYSYPASGISPDIITEISEQVVSEKLSEIRKHLESVIDFRTTIEAKTESIEERLKRIEKIIDTLQSSVLRKIGNYVNNVDDIKKELIATQKSFSKLVPRLKTHASTKKRTPKKTKKK